MCGRCVSHTCRAGWQAHRTSAGIIRGLCYQGITRALLEDMKDEGLGEGMHLDALAAICLEAEGAPGVIAY